MRPMMRMWKQGLVFVAVAALGVPVIAHADFFRYETEGGTIAFTDDAERIPSRYRDTAETVPEQSIHDYERTTRVERHPNLPVIQRMYETTLVEPPVRKPAPREQVVTIEAADGVLLDVPASGDEPIVVETGILSSDGRGTSEHTIVRQGDRIVLEVKEPLFNWIEP